MQMCRSAVVIHGSGASVLVLCSLQLNDVPKCSLVGCTCFCDLKYPVINHKVPKCSLVRCICFYALEYLVV